MRLLRLPRSLRSLDPLDSKHLTGLAMTSPFCHCEELCDEAISEGGDSGIATPSSTLGGLQLAMARRQNPKQGSRFETVLVLGILVI